MRGLANSLADSRRRGREKRQRCDFETVIQVFRERSRFAPAFGIRLRQISPICFELCDRFLNPRDNFPGTIPKHRNGAHAMEGKHILIEDLADLFLATDHAQNGQACQNHRISLIWVNSGAYPRASEQGRCIATPVRRPSLIRPPVRRVAQSVARHVHSDQDILIREGRRWEVPTANINSFFRSKKLTCSE